MTSFLELGLSEKVIKTIENAGFKKPTPIQKASISHILQHKDLLGIAQTGTGKTGAFILPILTLLEKSRARARMPRIIILEPTRDLASQVENNFQKFGKNHKFTTAMLIGGTPFEEQEKALLHGVDIIIATPGRLLDLFERGKLILSGIQIFVIDEADKMLDLGFLPDIERISKNIPFTRQMLFFSATMPPEIEKLSEKFLHCPVIVKVDSTAKTAGTIDQKFIKSEDKSWEKRATLRFFLEKEKKDIKNAIIFCNKKKDVSELFRSCIKHGYNVGSLHGDMDQSSRTSILSNFKSGNLKYLIASDVAARGLDIDDISHVFNYDVPTNPEDYIHRIGRTGRAGRLGKSFTIVTKKDEKYLKAIVDLTKITPEWVEVDFEEPKNYKNDQETKSSSPKKTKNSQKKKETLKNAPKMDEKKLKTSEKKRLPKKKAESRSIAGFGNHVPAFMRIEL